MIVIIGFVAMVVIIFRYYYLRIADPDCRKNTTDGVTYKDAFGKTRLLRNGRKVLYKKDNNGRIRMFYDNGCAVDEFNNYKDQAIFNGEPDYVCRTWHDIPVVKVVKTGEEFLSYNLNGCNYYCSFGEDQPIQIVRECYPDEHNDSLGVNIEIYNKLLVKWHNPNKFGYDYGYCALNDYYKWKRGRLLL